MKIVINNCFEYLHALLSVAPLTRLIDIFGEAYLTSCKPTDSLVFSVCSMLYTLCLASVLHQKWLITAASLRKKVVNVS